MTDKVLKSIAQVPAVALLGSRQVGKTTFAEVIAKKQHSIYLDLENPEDMLKVTSYPSGFLGSHSDKLIILDEIQRIPDLFPILRVLIDENRKQGRHNGQFLLLGSASMDLLRQSSESLAGRISYTEMSGLNMLEVGEDEGALWKLWFRGGFPNSYLAADDDQAMDWLEDMIRTYLERDVPQMGFRAPANQLRRLWTMLARLQGETVNVSRVARNLEISRHTVSQYIDILTDLLLVRRLEPWQAGVGKRLVKSLRCYVRDSGIQHRLLGIDSRDALLSHPVLSKSWEGFVIENIHSVLPRRAQTCFYHTAAGAQIDLVIKLPSAEIWAIETRHSVAPQPGRHYSRTCDDVGATAKYIVYGGTDEFPISEDITVISLPRLLQKLNSRGIETQDAVP